jgi:hypothetical protein
MYMVTFFFRFSLLVFAFFSATIDAAIDPFKQNIETVLHGKKNVQISSAIGQDLRITITKKKSLKRTFYDVSFTLDGEQNEEGAFLTIFPTKDHGYLGYLKWLHKIPNKYSGTKLLQALDLFCKEVKLTRVFLIDASEIDTSNEEQSESSFSLRNFHILSDPNHTSWYESRGYDPISNKTALQWIRWITRQSESSFLYVKPISKKIYREAAQRFAAVNCERYLLALDSLSGDVDLFAEHAEKLKALLKMLPSYDASYTFAEAIQKLGVIDRQKQLELMCELDDPLTEEDQIKQFLTLIFDSDRAASSDASYAAVLLIQSLFRDSYNFQTVKERKTLFKHVIGSFNGKSFTYERDMSSFRYMLSDEEREKIEQDTSEVSDDSEDREFVVQALQYLGKTKLQLFFDYADEKNRDAMLVLVKNTKRFPSRTVAQMVKKLKDKKRNLFFEQVLFGGSSYYRHVSSFVEKLQSSADDKEFFLGCLLNEALLDQATFLEQGF